MMIGIGAALNAQQSESSIIAMCATLVITTGVWIIAYITFNKEE